MINKDKPYSWQEIAVLEKYPFMLRREWEEADQWSLHTIKDVIYFNTAAGVDGEIGFVKGIRREWCVPKSFEELADILAEAVIYYCDKARTSK